MSLFGAPPPVPTAAEAARELASAACKLGLSASAHAIEASLDDPRPTAKTSAPPSKDPNLPKHVHDSQSRHPRPRAAQHHPPRPGRGRHALQLSHQPHPRLAHPRRRRRPFLLARPHPRPRDPPARSRRRHQPPRCPSFAEQIAESAPTEHHIPKDEPTLGGAVTREMLFASPESRTSDGGFSGVQPPPPRLLHHRPPPRPRPPPHGTGRRPRRPRPSSAKCLPPRLSTWTPSPRPSTRAPATASISTRRSSSATSSSTR